MIIASTVIPSFKTQLGIKGRPYRATYEDRLLKHRPGGKTLEDLQTGLVCRSKDGRERREFVFSGQDGEILLFDPNTSEIVTLRLATKSASRLRLRTDGGPAAMILPWRCKVAGPSGELLPTESSGTQSLGQRQIEGLTCRGFSKQDNTGMITEYWYSDELGGAVLVTSVGKQEEGTWKLTDIQLREPDSYLFVVPANYHESVFTDP